MFLGVLKEDFEVNPLLDPHTCQEMIDQAHARLGIDYSYGGWLEDRSELWQGSYLDTNQTHIHLGVDFNVPAGTLVAVDEAVEVLFVDCDFPVEGGWGNRVIVRSIEAGDILIYAHLADEVRCSPGEKLQSGQVFASVGSAPKNGGWFPHLHVQIVDGTYFESLTGEALNLLDGYGAKKELTILAERFKDPLTQIKLAV